MSTKTAPAKKSGLTAYCMKTKEKNVPIQEPVIMLKGGKYIAKGHDGKGNTLTTILAESKAKEALESGSAQPGEGIAAAKKKKA